MKGVLLFVLMIATQTALAQSYSVVSLLSENALVTGRLLPFKVYDQNHVAQAIDSVRLSGNQCQVVRDPFYNTIIHLYCETEQTLNLSVEFSGGKTVSLQGLAVKSPAIVEESDGSDDVDTEGQQLFTNNCKACHGPTPIETPLSILNLKKALNKEPMKGRGLNQLFTDEQLEKILQYINEEL